eukprot:scaffold445823_cov16-Prasinocladus_malaysianus.AAC.1
MRHHTNCCEASALSLRRQQFKRLASLSGHLSFAYSLSAAQSVSTGCRGVVCIMCRIHLALLMEAESASVKYFHWLWRGGEQFMHSLLYTLLLEFIFYNLRYGQPLVVHLKFDIASKVSSQPSSLTKHSHYQGHSTSYAVIGVQCAL